MAAKAETRAESTVQGIIAGMQAQGLELTLSATGGLAVTPASRLNDHQRGLIRDNRAAIMARLSAANDPQQSKKLLIRDREHDDRRMCLECSCLTGGMGGWRCTAFRQRGAREPGLPADLVGMLQRCPVFVAGEPSTSGYYTTARPSNGPKIPSQVNARGPWLSASETAAAQEYHHHHAHCPQCQSAGRGHTKHCGAGAALWNDYTKEKTP